MWNAFFFFFIVFNGYHICEICGSTTEWKGQIFPLSILTFEALVFTAEWGFDPSINKCFVLLDNHSWTVIYQSHRAASPERGWPACRSLLCAELLVSGAERIKSLWQIIWWQKEECWLIYNWKFNSSDHLSFSVKPLHKCPWQPFLNYILQLNLSNLFT